MKPCLRCGEYHSPWMGCDDEVAAAYTATKKWKPEPIFAFLGDYAFDAHAAYASMQLLIEVLGPNTYCVHDADLILMRSEHR